MTEPSPEKTNFDSLVDDVIDLANVWSEGWPTFPITTPLVGAYQLGRLLSAESWIRFVAELKGSDELANKVCELQQQASDVATKIKMRSVNAVLNSHFEKARLWFRSDQHVANMEELAEDVENGIYRLWDPYELTEFVELIGRKVGPNEQMAIEVGVHVDQAIRRTRPAGVESWASVFTTMVLANSLPLRSSWYTQLLELLQDAEFTSSLPESLGELSGEDSQLQTLDLVGKVDQEMRAFLKSQSPVPALGSPSGPLGICVNSEFRIVGRSVSNTKSNYRVKLFGVCSNNSTRIQIDRFLGGSSPISTPGSKTQFRKR